MGRTVAILSMWIFFYSQAAAQVSCGDQPKIPPDVEQQIKGDVEGKAQIFTKLLGDAQLKGKVEASKKELQQKYKDVDRAQLHQYMAWISCQNIMQDKALTAQEKSRLWLDLYRELMRNRDISTDSTKAIRAEHGVLEVKYQQLRNAEFELTYWASIADKVRIVKSGETKVTATIDCFPYGSASAASLSNSVPAMVAGFRVPMNSG